MGYKIIFKRRYGENVNLSYKSLTAALPWKVLGSRAKENCSVEHEAWLLYFLSQGAPSLGLIGSLKLYGLVGVISPDPFKLHRTICTSVLDYLKRMHARYAHEKLYQRVSKRKRN